MLWLFSEGPWLFPEGLWLFGSVHGRGGLLRRAGGVTGVAKLPDHFAWKERDFYATCTIKEYYGRFAQPRLQYDAHFKALLKIFPPERVVVVSTDRITADPAGIATLLKARAAGDDSTVILPCIRKSRTISAAQVGLDPRIRKEPDRIQSRLRQSVRKSGICDWM